MKQILKSLKAHRSKTAALFIEIMIVTVIGWIVVLPVAVLTTNVIQPASYDYERLVHVQFSKLTKDSEGYDSTRKDPLPDYRVLLDKIRQYEGVETATFSSFQAFESSSSSSTGIEADSIYGLSEDESYIGANIVNYIPGTDFFATYGIKTPNGEAVREPEGRYGYIVNESVAKCKYPNKSPIGLNLHSYDPQDENERPSPILGITQNTPYRKSEPRSRVIFAPVAEHEMQWTLDGVTLRLKEGVNARRFADTLADDLYSFRSGNAYLTHPTLFTDRRATICAQENQKLTQSWLILSFFLMNVLLGVAGTFYIQSRSRIMDAGVMRAFGATRRDIMGGILGEAVLTVVLAWAAGCILYIAYHLTVKPEFDYEEDAITRILNPMWYDQVPERFAVIGLIILVLLLVCALAGVILPARRVASVAPIDALHDE